MQYICVLLAVCFIIALIGPFNIINLIAVLIIGIPIVAIGYAFLKPRFDEWSNNRNAKNQVPQTNSHIVAYFDRGYKTPPMITGDYFGGRDIPISEYVDCRYANTATCAYCARRKEHRKEQVYYYGKSFNCEERNPFYCD